MKHTIAIEHNNETGAGLVSTDEGFVSYITFQDIDLDDEGNEVSDGDPYFLIDLVEVESEKRGKGLSRKLMQETIRNLKEKDSSKSIKLVVETKDTDTDFSKLVEFYESLGFDADEKAGEVALMVL